MIADAGCGKYGDVQPEATATDTANLAAAGQTPLATSSGAGHLENRIA